MDYAFAIFSPLGWWSLKSQEHHLVAIDWWGEELLEQTRTKALTKLEQRLDCMLSRYFKGEPVDFSRVPVQLSGTSFQNSVWEALRKVPYGESKSYQWLATNSGNPKAVRAVGGALGRNPLPIVIPCHRIITSSGTLGGFMQGMPGGLQIKSTLLALEGLQIPRAKDHQPKISNTFAG